MFHTGYSQNLLRLMHREGEIFAQGGDVGSLGQRVEKMLASETARVFKLRGQHSEERWRALLERQRQYRGGLSLRIQEEQRGHQETSEQMSAPGGLEESKLPNHQEQHHGYRRRSDGMQQQQQHREGTGFAAKEAAMRAASAARWAEDERFNLKNAFGLQLQRLEMDWEAHEIKVREEYDTHRDQIRSRSGMSTPGGGDGARYGSRGGTGVADAASASSMPWRSREKQSRLIHTAPVFQPETGRASSAGGAGGQNSAQVAGRTGGGLGKNGDVGYWARGAATELERLDEAFAAVGAQVSAQKEAAKKWTRRQRIRMEVCVCVSPCLTSGVL
ncbi:hypothetical protein Esi_0278_0041 [Ectocarpus siliculosus]|uniref:Uncharacterized protein n=1 Tax=Ectocarpus siliculosus TaxID=2880 RepID=D7FUS5_ECTSI|nr:hypothetical protein Esi_0278_0041 [Ectocarpus siliculosus]|eukprot:CBJ31731.1 hypothetical protein Esi_0278_0041 [Ectocarpus siliculosus]